MGSIPPAFEIVAEIVVVHPPVEGCAPDTGEPAQLRHRVVGDEVGQGGELPGR